MNKIWVLMWLYRNHMLRAAYLLLLVPQSQYGKMIEVMSSEQNLLAIKQIY